MAFRSISFLGESFTSDLDVLVEESIRRITLAMDIADMRHDETCCSDSDQRDT